MVSQPVRLHWMGWETNTYELERNGWELSAHQDMHRGQMALAIRHSEMQVRGMSEFMQDWDFRRSMNIYDDPRSWPVLGCKLANDLRITTHQAGTSEYAFHPIDARPMYSESRIQSLDDLAHFRKLEKPGNEIFLKKASMADILEMALSRQEPKQEQIRKEMVRRQELEIMEDSQLKAHLRLVS
jgi:hypothetical protein